VRLESRTIETPIGPILLAGTSRGLALARVVEREGEARAWARSHGVELHPDEGSLDTAARAYERYFAGRLREFEIPIDPAWGSPFQRAVWDALRKIPYGTTTTYGALAGGLGLAPGASRAVGSANGANPIVIAVPCHRVVRKGGGLGGFACGLWRKEHLLRLEGSRPVQPALL
jgi:O-6-methylguanine DNA methyltransferase